MIAVADTTFPYIARTALYPMAMSFPGMLNRFARTMFRTIRHLPPYKTHCRKQDMFLLQNTYTIRNLPYRMNLLNFYTIFFRQ
jgi:hypothetical protein